MRHGFLICAAAAAILSAGPATAAGDDKTPPADGERILPVPSLTAPSASIDPRRFGNVPDPAFGAYQRGLYITAFNLARPRAENGDAAAQTLIAEIYARGLGVRSDPQQAAHWYQRAAEQGNPDAQFQYALLLIDGRYVEKDEDQAFALMEDAANAGNLLAQFNFAQMLVDRMPGPGGLRRAVGFYEQAARGGLPDAQYAMAQVYANGAGGRERDDEAARRWLMRAARQNYDTAQLELGTWLVQGRGGEIDEEAGFSWLKRAAESGNVAASNRLAKLYRAGVGTEANSVTAAAWYILARRAGLVDPELDTFMEGLTDAQRRNAIAQANRLR
jgi:TPR repeat protein